MSSRLSRASLKHSVSYILNESDERSTSRPDPMDIDSAPPRKRHPEQPSNSEKKHACDICSRRFKLVADLRKHKDNVHFGMKKFECELCGNKFSERGNLNKHVKRIHEKSRTVTCPIEGCPSTFVLKEGLMRHMKVHEKAARGSLPTSVKPKTDTSSQKRAITPRSSAQHHSVHHARPW